MKSMYDDPFGKNAWLDAPDDYYEQAAPEPGAGMASDPGMASAGDQQASGYDAGMSDEEAAAAFARREAERAENRQALYDRLNTEQREAVFMPHESALVLAAAGSGKTSVLTARVARLISDGEPSLPATAVMAVTFTNKASQEMKARLRPLLNKSAINELWVGTFHSLCNRILRENYAEAGLPKSFAILDTDGQESLVRNILKDFGLTKASVKEAKKLAALAKPDLLGGADPLAGVGEGDQDDEEALEFVTPKQCVSHINGKKERNKKPEVITHQVTAASSDDEQMEAVFGEYQERLERQGLLDFQDLLARAVELLRTNPAVRQQYQDRFKAILVDEFQDTNDIQFEWLELLKGPKCHVTAVGDDDQSIYAFRGADPRNMGKFLKVMAATPQHPKGRMIRLEQNYRSLPHILEAANAIIDRNTNRLGKVLRTTKPDAGEMIDLVTYGSGNFEASSIAAKIYDRIKNDGTSPSEIAVLYRTNMQSRSLEQELNKLGVPLTVYGGFRFYERQEIKNVLAYLDLVADISRDLSFVRVANFPPRGIGERTLEDLRQQAQSDRISMIEMVEKRAQLMMGNPSSVGNAAAQKKLRQLHAFTTTILDLADAAEKMPLSRLIEEIVKQAGIEEHYKSEATGSKSSEEEAKERMDNISELISAARQFELENPLLRSATEQLPEYLSFVALMTSTSESDMSKKNTVSLMTVHSSKGLEFDHVYIAGLEEGVFPHARAIAEDEERGNGRSIEEGSRMVYVGGLPQDQYVELDDGPGLQEERRLMYVAVTRARKTLTISHAMERMNNGDSRECEASRFLSELPDGRLNRIDDRQTPTAPRAERRQKLPLSTPTVASATKQAPGDWGSTSSAAGAMGRRVAIIGTAGRDKTEVMNKALWEAMLADARRRVNPEDVLVSGGAAWADHLAVRLFLDGSVKGLKLYLPAPLQDMRFQGPDQSSASAANYYHERFLELAEVDGLGELEMAIQSGADVQYEPASPGYSSMFRRNAKVAAASDAVIAYTFGNGDEPADGGTKNTWDQVNGVKVHVALTPLRMGTPLDFAPSMAAGLTEMANKDRFGSPARTEVTPAVEPGAKTKPWIRRAQLPAAQTQAPKGMHNSGQGQKAAPPSSPARPTTGHHTHAAPAGVMNRLNILGGQTRRAQPAQTPSAPGSRTPDAEEQPAPASSLASKLPASARRFLRT